MEEIKTSRNVELTSYKFDAKVNYRHHYVSLLITEGEIVEAYYEDSRCCNFIKKDKPYFTKSCLNIIYTIAKENPEELKNIYHTLSDGVMKEFCKQLQQYMIAQLQF